MKCDVAVIGGGVIGLACAWRLAQGGAKVTLFERGTVGREASWAAAGMLAPLIEAARHPPADPAARQAMLDLCLQSRDLYTHFVAELVEATQTPVDLHLKGAPPSHRPFGSFYLATRDDDATPAALAELKEYGEIQTLKLQTVPKTSPNRLLSKAVEIEGEFYSMPTTWRSAIEAGRLLWLGNEGRVNNRQMLKALFRAAKQAGVQIFQSEPVNAVLQSDGKLSGLRLRNAHVQCDQALLCAGTWSHYIEGSPLPGDGRFAPVKGQIVLLKEHCLPGLDATVYASDVYLVPRAHNRCLVGSTMERGRVSRLATVSGVQKLLDAACGVLPDLKYAHLETTWAGLRPATPDGLPILGRTPLENLFVATGHFRNGILLAPMTAQLMADCILNGKEPPPEFNIERFAS